MYGPPARNQYDENSRFPALSVPFISCYIGSDLEKGVHIGNTHLQKVDGMYDSKFIKSISVKRSVPDHSSGLFSALLNYIRSMNTSGTLTEEEKIRFGKDAAKEAEKRKKQAEEAKEKAPKELEEALKNITNRYLHSVNMGGISATISLSLIGEVNLMTWLYNYSVSQKMKTNIRLQYGIMAGQGQRLRISPVYEGIITSAKISNFFDLELSATFLPGKTLGWNPEKFNEIFKDPSRPKDAAKKANNDVKPYKEGQTVVSVNEKTRRYSNVVRRIAEGLGWNIGHIEPTTLMPEGVLLTVEGFEEGPLEYIQTHFCGTVDQKDGNGKTVKAGAISEQAHLIGYTAYFDYDENGVAAFYYVPTQAFTKRTINGIRLYTYRIRGIGDANEQGGFLSEVLEFTISPIDIRTTMFNVEKGDGKGETNLPVIDNSKKEVGNTTYTTETNVKTSGAATAKKMDKGSAQNLAKRNLFGSNAKYATETFEVNQQNVVANTWTSQLKATLKVLYDESLRLLQVIYVSVLMPMNDSTTIQGEINTRLVVHPSSGYYRILAISDDISGGTATTTLGLIRVPCTQQEINQMSRMLESSKQQAEKEKQAKEKQAQQRREAEANKKQTK